jgi:peroxiredoxin/mono/diheme cytochrome c family protein
MISHLFQRAHRRRHAALFAAAFLVAAPKVSAGHMREVPNFNLRDLRGRNVELHRADAKYVVLFFTGVGCPVARLSAAKLAEVEDAFRDSGVAVWVVDSFPKDSVEELAHEVYQLGLNRHPCLRDSNQALALALGVQRTAEVVVVRTGDWGVVYQGAIDDQLTEGAQRPAPTVKHLEAALREEIGGKPVTTPRTAAHGCRIAYATADATPSYAADIAPMLRENCANCHRDGGIGPWPMSGYAKVRNYAKMIEEVVLTGQMPPWHADPDFGKFSNHRGLSDEQTQKLLRWIAAGAPRGEGADPLEEPLKPIADWPLGKPDIVVKLPQPESIPATGVVDYRHLSAKLPVSTDVWLSGIDVKPGNRKVVHHVILRAKWPGGPDDGSGRGVNIAGWAPGMNLPKYPKGVGKTIPAGAELDFELHYTTVGTPETDQSEAAFYLLPAKPERELLTREAVQLDLDIPPGVDESRESAVYAFKKPATLYTLMPHMHTRGKSAKFELLTPDGRRETLLNVPRYDFNWQTVYYLDTPRKVPAGSWLLMTGAFDNSAGNTRNPNPKARIHFGLQTWDEMFIGFLDAADEPEAQASPQAGAPGAGAGEVVRR